MALHWTADMPFLDIYITSLQWVNSWWPSDTILWHRSGSRLAQVMARCLAAPSHYLDWCLFIISKVQWHSSESNFTRNTLVINHLSQLENRLISYSNLPVASFTKEVNPRLAKRPLKTNGRLANLELTSLVKEATGVDELNPHLYHGASFQNPTIELPHTGIINHNKIINQHCFTCPTHAKYRLASIKLMYSR